MRPSTSPAPRRPPRAAARCVFGGLVVACLAAASPSTAQAPPQPEDEAPPPSDRIEFVYPISEEEGGGQVEGTAGAFEGRRDETVVLTGGVELVYQDLTFTAERMEVDLAAQTLSASGEVVFDQGPRRITGESLEFDLATKTGTLTEAVAFVAPDYFFRGSEVAKVGEDVYEVENGLFTSCIGDDPDWSFKLGRARIDLGGYARVKRASMRVKDAPVLFFPYLVWPVQDDRSSGLLVPQPGYSKRRGGSLSIAWFQTLGRSADTTFELDLWSDGFVGLGNELRYRPTEGTDGVLVGYAVDDPEFDEVRWKIDWYHQTRDLPWGLRGVVNFRDFSDFEFFRDFERDFDRNTIRSLDSRGFVSGNWGPHSLNVLVNQQETFISEDNTVTLAKLPEIEYRLRPTQLGDLPLYLRLDSSLDYLSLDRRENFQSDYLRADFFPQLTLPIRTVPWLSLSVTAGERVTFYGDRLRSDEEIAAREAELPEGAPVDRFAGDSLTRAVPFAAAELVGPSLSRIFEKRVGSFTRFKHVLEPRITYTFFDAFDRQRDVPLFDEVDRVRSNNRGRVAIINRLLAKSEPAPVPAAAEAEPTEATAGAEPGVEREGAPPDEAAGEDGEEAPEAAATVAEDADGGEPADGEEAPAEGEEAPAAPAFPRGGGSAREILSLEIGQDFSFDDDRPLQSGSVEIPTPGGELERVLLTRSAGPIDALLRFNPRPGFSIKAGAVWSTLFDAVESTSVSANARFGNRFLGLTWFTRQRVETGDFVRNQVRLSGGFDLLPRKLRIEGQVNYDFDEGLLQQQRWTADWTSQCYAVRLELYDFRIGDEIRDTSYRFALSLKNVGTFLDLTGGFSNRPGQ